MQAVVLFGRVKLKNNSGQKRFKILILLDLFEDFRACNNCKKQHNNQAEVSPLSNVFARATLAE